MPISTTPTRRDHENMLHDPNQWSLWPILPLRRPRIRDEMGFPQLGLVIDPKGMKQVGYTVYVMNLHEIERGRPLSESLAKAKAKFEYENVYELLNDGWEVD